ncbi:hypothetical protein JTE90_019571 [Oedothorax gibbosus]|uniref:Uncharacterized protein n=1 Tax=Oedothorax gibbosus TaxID=931172 RepID=A0AAV6V5V6_9ARAC|nr:hypothetical protein JTE90_019571 [Oedothorax gibbosus]
MEHWNETKNSSRNGINGRKVVIPTTPHTRTEHQHHSTKNIAFRFSHLRDMFSILTPCCQWPVLSPLHPKALPLSRRPCHNRVKKERHLQQSVKNPQGNPRIFGLSSTSHNAKQDPNKKNQKNVNKKRTFAGGI